MATAFLIALAAPACVTEVVNGNGPSGLIDGEEVCLFEGDIRVACDIPSDEVGVAGSSSELAVVRHLEQIWPAALVPFVIDPELPNPERIHQAIRHWQNYTPLRFSNQVHGVLPGMSYVMFRRVDEGCWSPVGRVGHKHGSGAQDIGLADDCDASAVIHEIGHTVGLWHTQSRMDRDNHVIIRWENIEPGQEHNFQTYQEGYDLGPYDIESIMHYSSYAFSTDGDPTIVARNGDLISNTTQLSRGDREYIATLYCPEVNYRSPSCALAHNDPYRPPVAAETRASTASEYTTTGVLDLGTATAETPTLFTYDGVRIRNFDNEAHSLVSARFEGRNASSFFVQGVYRSIAAGGSAALSVGARNLPPGRHEATLVLVISGNWAPDGYRFPREARTAELRIQVVANALS